MTIVIGILDKDNEIVFGGDRRVTNGRINILATSKVFKKKKMLFGVSGKALLLQTLMHDFEIPRHPKNMSDEKYMYTIFINALKSIFEKNRVSQIDKNTETTFSSILIGYKNIIYTISSDLCILKYASKFICIGSGRDYATGVLESILRKTNVLDIESIKQAIQITAKYDYACDSNINVVTIKNKYNEEST
jgi:ATP-dependent protease HslVU (ClpYQ) peptidase subunit